MGGVYVGRLRGVLGFEQLVAIKRPHAHLMDSPSVKRSLMAEARLASLIRHANVVGVRDVEATDDSILLVMDYVEGASLLELVASAEDEDRSEMIRAGLRIVLDVCAGLQAVHDLTDPQGAALGLVHRDVSPHNMLVGLDGVGRIADFGIAKSLNGGDASTREGTIKGKVAYMAPEYVQGHVDQRCDVFSIGVVLWELLAGRRLFAAEGDAQTLHRVLTEPVPVVSTVAPDLGTALDDVVARALERQPDARFARAADLMNALEAAIAGSRFVATHRDVARFVQSKVGEALAERRDRVNACLQGVSVTAASDDADGTGGTQSLTLPKPTQTASRRLPSIAAAVGAVGLLALLALLAAGRAIGPSARQPAVTPSPSTSAVTAPEPSPPPESPIVSPAVATTTSAPIAAPAASASAKEQARPAPRRALPKPVTPPPASADGAFHNPY